jgi:hypothetical protein
VSTIRCFESCCRYSLVHGPVLIEDASSTLAVPGDVVVVRDAADNIIITLSADAADEDRAADFTTDERERAVNV